MLLENTDIHVPIYQRLYNHYREAIFTQQYSPGSRIDSIHELMQKHGVSRETAKLVLKKLAGEGLILQKAGKGSFVLNRSPQKAAWGVVVPFFSAQIDGLLAALADEAVRAKRTVESFVSYNNWQEEIRLVGTLIHRKYEAVLVVPTFDETKTAHFYRTIQSFGSLLMLLNHTMAGSSFTYVIQSVDLGVKRGMQYLLEKSPPAVAFVKNQGGAGRNLIQEFMEATFKNCVESASLPIKAFTVNRLQNLNAQWLRRKGVGGIFCCDDLDAVGVLGRLRGWGIRIPEDISVISYGNTDLARYFTPKITSVNSHYEDMARIAAGIIARHARGESTRNEQHVILPTLIVRDT